MEIANAGLSSQAAKDQAKRELTAKQLKKLKVDINPYEWTKQLDLFLLDSVIRNYFNYDMVSLELNDEAKRLNLYFGATHSFTNHKCRIRWSYLHMKRLLDKEIKYRQLPFRVSVEQQDLEQENKTLDLNKSKKEHEQKLAEQEQKRQRLQESEPQKELEQKKYEGITKMKPPKSLADIEKELWKKNITFHTRQKKDILDVSNEDFSKNKSISADGKEINPSNFNIFRDSLRKTSEKLLQTLQENLPDINLKELDLESESEKDEDNTDDEEVLPLDFRTALIEGENKVIIQAKPLHFKTDEEFLKEMEENLEKGNHKFQSIESYLDAVKNEPFKDENVILIDPDINIKEKFDQIDLLCNKEHRINNALNAPVKTKEQILREQHLLNQLKTQQKAPVNSKQYDTDTDGEEEFMQNQRNQSMNNIKQKIQQQQQQQQMKQTLHNSNIKANSDNLDFNDVLKQWGVSDLNALIPGVSSASESESERTNKKPLPKQEKKPEQKKEPSQQVPSGQGERSAQQRIGLIQSIMQENRMAQQARSDQNSQPTSIDMLMSSLQDL